MKPIAAHTRAQRTHDDWECKPGQVKSDIDLRVCRRPRLFSTSGLSGQANHRFDRARRITRALRPATKTTRDSPTLKVAVPERKYNRKNTGDGVVDLAECQS